MKVTVDSIRDKIDLEAVHRYMAEFRELGDYERRLLEMGLRNMNRNNARFLPPKAVELLFPDEHCSTPPPLRDV